MNIPTNHQVITHQGTPVAVVVPYGEYLSAFSNNENIISQTTQASDEVIPHEIASRVLREQISPIRAWREYLGLTQAEVASRMDISQSAFAQMENAETKQRRTTLKKVAVALGITVEQLAW